MELAKGAFYHIHTPYSSPSQALPTSRFLSPHLTALSLFLLVFWSFHSSFTSKSLSPSLRLFTESFTPSRLTKGIARVESCRNKCYRHKHFFTLTFSVFSLSPSITEAVDILKEMKEKDVVMNDTHLILLFHMLNSLVAKGDASTVQRLQDTIFTLGLAKPTTNLCSPLVTVYLNR